MTADVIKTGLSGSKLFKYLKDNFRDIKAAKMAAIKCCDGVSTMPLKKTIAIEYISKSGAAKAFTPLFKNDIDNGVLERSVIASTYLWLDSHDDVHGENVFTKTITERGGNAQHYVDHIPRYSNLVGRVKGYTEIPISWNDLNVDHPGMTKSLIMDTAIYKSLNEKIYNEYLNGFVDQHSVSMYYVDLRLAVADKSYKEEYALYQSVIDKIGNKKSVNEQGYFYYTNESKLVETSTVTSGSNELTGVLSPGEPNLTVPQKAYSKTKSIDYTNYFLNRLNNK